MSEKDRERWMGGYFYINRNMKDCPKAHLEFPPGVEFLQALHSLLPVHHGGNSGPLLQGEDERIWGLRGHRNNGWHECIVENVWPV